MASRKWSLVWLAMDAFSLTPALLYLSFHLPCLASAKRKDGDASPPAGGEASARMCSLPSGVSFPLRASGAGAVRVTCPELEPLIERSRSSGTSSHVQE